MARITLIGDSIFDNAVYVTPGPSVSELLRSLGHEVALVAVDGATTREIPRQLASIPREHEWSALSIGGNDLLQYEHLLADGAGSLHELGRAAERFRASYVAALAAVERCVAGRLLVCTIYEGNLGREHTYRAKAAAGVFDDVIRRAAAERALPVLELRDVFTEPAHYANPIEPSVEGGRRLAAAISEWVEGRLAEGRGEAAR